MAFLIPEPELLRALIDMMRPRPDKSREDAVAHARVAGNRLSQQLVVAFAVAADLFTMLCDPESFEALQELTKSVRD